MRAVTPSILLTALLGVGIACIACGSSESSSDGADSGVPADGSEGGASSSGDGGAPDARDFSLSFTGDEGAPVSTAPGAITESHGLNATAGAGLTYVAGHPGAAGVLFPGTGSALVVDSADVVRLGVGANAPFTLEVGFRTEAHGRDGDAGAAVLFERKGAFSARIQDGKLTVLVGANEMPIGLDPLVSDGMWHRLIVTRDTSMNVIEVVLDGITSGRLQGEHVNDALDGDPVLTVGAQKDGTHGFYGAIDHVALSHHATPAFTSALTSATSTIFASDAEPVPGGGTYAYVRIPSIVRAADGALVVAAEGRVDSSADLGNIDVIVKRSTDGGRTWSDAVVAGSSGTDKVGNPILFSDLLDKKLVLLSLVTHVNGDPSQVRVQTSTDDGATWSTPKDITQAVILPAWRDGVLVGPSHGVQLVHGSNAGTLVVHGMHNRATDGRRGGHVWISRDHGATWSVSATENESAPGVEVNEGSLAELTDGRLYVNVRHQSGDVEGDRPSGLRGEAFVGADLLYTGAPPFERTKTFRGPVVEGATLRWPGSDRYGDDARILFSFPAGESGTNFGQRHDLRLFTSHDDAKSFGPPVRIFGGKSSYSDLVAIDDSRVGLIYETAPDGLDFNTRVAFRSRPLQSIDDATVVAFGFETQTVGSPIATEKSLGPTVATARPEGTVRAVAGRLHSTAAHFDGSRLCTTDADLEHSLDLDIHDGFEIEASFRTTAHAAGGSAASGALVAKTILNEAAAWWLRVEDGKVRFAVGDATHLDSVVSKESVSDGKFHVVRAARATKSGKLTISIDGKAAVTTPITTTDVVTNADDLCLGAFGGANIPRPFTGDIDSVLVRVHD